MNVVALMHETREHFLEHGGHAFAGGFSVSHEEIHTLEVNLLEALKDLPRETTEETHEVDLELALGEVNEHTWKELKQFAPFGEANPKPVFLFKDVIIETAHEFGKEKNHLELVLKGAQGGKVKAIEFFKTKDDYEIPLEPGEKVSVVATVEKSFFGRRPEVRLRIVDIIK